MPLVKQYQVDYFAVFVLITAILIIIFLIVIAIYFMNIMNGKIPSKGESTFLFWTSIVLGLVFLGILIYSLVRLFTNTVYVVEEDKVLVPELVPVTKPKVITVTTTPTVVSTPKIVTTPTFPETIYTNTGAYTTSSVPGTIYTTSVPNSRVVVNKELVSLGELA